jgi:hypothetical protein
VWLGVGCVVSWQLVLGWLNALSLRGQSRDSGGLVGGGIQDKAVKYWNEVGDQ